MHLLAATPGSVDEGQEPVDLGQTPADIIVISAADTELAALSEARSEMPSPPTLRLVNLTHLQHPMSVDLHIEACASKSRIVIARVLGGTGYWSYGIAQYSAACHIAKIPFIALPGDDKPDRELRDLSTIPADKYDTLWSYLVEGGPTNHRNFLEYVQALLDDRELPPSPAPLLKAGVYWPGIGSCDLGVVKDNWIDGASVVPIIFYRALVQGAGLNPVNRLVKALLRKGLNPLPTFVASLKDPLSQATVEELFSAAPPDVILNATSFAVGSPNSEDGSLNNPLASPSANKATVFQVIFSSGTEDAWEKGSNGLSARDIAMNVALPEVDGRILSRAVSFKDEAFFDEATQCPIATYRARGDRITFVADLAANWASLRRRPAAEKKVALILANYPNKDGRLANGVGLDTPAATVHALNLLRDQGLNVTPPADAPELMAQIAAGPTNWLTDRTEKKGGVCLTLDIYRRHYSALPYDVRQKIEDQWGPPEQDPFLDSDRDGFALSIHSFGHAIVGLQPARGYNIDPTETYHSPDLVPPHNYIAFYFWLRHHWNADAIVHMGKHGNLEWLPGKAVALSETCIPEAVVGPVPHIYPFIVNDPGEGTQAKRRTQAVIIDHLTPPLTRAETYGPLRDLEALVDEYYEAAGVDPRRLDHLRREILSLTAATGLDRDVGMAGEDETNDLAKLDAYLCELKEAQIRDGLHIFGQSPEGRLQQDLAIALTRVPRGDGKGKHASITRAIAEDLNIGIDPLDCEMSHTYEGPRPLILKEASDEHWRSNGDTIERLELLAQNLLRDGGWGDGANPASPVGPRTQKVLGEINDNILPTIAACGPQEGAGLLTALSGQFVAPAPSGAPTRGRLDTLPTGKNFFSVDARAVPTPTAWALGWKSASLLIERYLQDNGDWPRTMLLTAWGTANMRTGGDDIAQCLALIGVKPTWDSANRRVTGFEILPLSVLDRPRVDVTLRISGFFRDAFPQLVALVDSAARAVMELDEPADLNPAAARARDEGEMARVYGSKPGAYGAGLQAMIDERLWSDRKDLADAYLTWGSYAYGKGHDGTEKREAFEARLGQVEAIVQNQDNREHDILDSDDYYQFEGGAAAAVASLQGTDRTIYHNDHSRPERPLIRTLDDEISRVMRSRAVNPKWIAGVMRHGYKGAFEMAATLDYLFAFAATTRAVKNHHFDLLHEAYLEEDITRKFIEDHNPAALKEMAERLQEAIDRGLWTPRSNSAQARIESLL